MTPYRDRLHAGEYQDKPGKGPKPKDDDQPTVDEMTVAQLRNELDKLGQDSTGGKAELRDRLAGYMK